RQLDELFVVRGGAQHGHAVEDRRADKPEDLPARTDVDALRRLAEQHHAGIRAQPLADERLLLVTAAEAAEVRPRERRLDGEVVADLLDLLTDGAPAQPPATEVLVKERDGQV